MVLRPSDMCLLSDSQASNYMLCVLSCSVVSNSCKPRDYSLPGSSVMGFPRQEYWSGLPFLSPGDVPDPGIECRSSALQADSLPSETSGKPILLNLIYLNQRKD